MRKVATMMMIVLVILCSVEEILNWRWRIIRCHIFQQMPDLLCCLLLFCVCSKSC